jgi:hypothetical protein
MMMMRPMGPPCVNTLLYVCEGTTRCEAGMKWIALQTITEKINEAERMVKKIASAPGTHVAESRAELKDCT